MTPLVTVIIATYNRSQTLRLTLASLLQQDCTDFEALIIGDACTDDSASVVQAFGDTRLHWQNLERNSGSQATPNNMGLRQARGEYIAYLGHDDLWFPWHLSSLIAVARATHADFAHALCALLGPEGVREGVGPPHPALDYATCFVPPSSWLHRRDLIGRCGEWGSPEQLPLAVDFEYQRRIQLSGARMRFGPRLSVLKFPSVWFRQAYTDHNQPLQITYHRNLAADPQTLERQVLQDLAQRFSEMSMDGNHPTLTRWWNQMRVNWRKTNAFFEMHEPFRSWLARSYQSHRRRLRRQRGLPAR